MKLISIYTMEDVDNLKYFRNGNGIIRNKELIDEAVYENCFQLLVNTVDYSNSFDVLFELVKKYPNWYLMNRLFDNKHFPFLKEELDYKDKLTEIQITELSKFVVYEEKVLTEKAKNWKKLNEL